VRPALPHHDPPDRRPAAPARPPGPLVDAQVSLEVALAIHLIKRRPVPSDRFAQHRADGAPERARLRRRDAVRAQAGMQPRAVHCLVGVDVAYARDEALIEQQGFQRPRVIARATGQTQTIVRSLTRRRDIGGLNLAGDVRARPTRRDQRRIDSTCGSSGIVKYRCCAGCAAGQECCAGEYIGTWPHKEDCAQRILHRIARDPELTEGNVLTHSLSVLKLAAIALSRM